LVHAPTQRTPFPVHFPDFDLLWFSSRCIHAHLVFASAMAMRDFCRVF
jgi:hypothetical protein